MTTGARDIWVYLAANPLLHLFLTLAAYRFGLWVQARAGGAALANPVLIAVAVLAGVLGVTGTRYEDYFKGAQFVHFLLGPATVALAIPLYRQFAAIRRSAPAILASLLSGSAAAALSAAGVAWAMGAAPQIVASIAPKSITAPVAMAVSEQIGGLPSLTSVMVILTGVMGAALGPMILDLVGVRDARARGLALGTASHGIGAARALQAGETQGAFAGLAMGLNALATALLLPLIWRLIAG